MTPFDRAQRFVGEVLERPGKLDHPLVQWWLSRCGFSLDTPDETPWCSAFVNGICWDLRLPRSKSAAARSWLAIGKPVALIDARPGYDVVIIKRGTGTQPGPEVIAAQGHVGFFAGLEGKNILILGGNQNNAITVAPFAVSRLLGVRSVA